MARTAIWTPRMVGRADVPRPNDGRGAGSGYGVPQDGAIAAVRRKSGPPIHALQFNRQPLPVHMYDDVVVGIVAPVRPRAHQMFDPRRICATGGAIRPQIRLTKVLVNRRPAASGHQLVESMYRASSVAVSLDEVFEEMFVSGHQQAHLMLPEEWHPP